jgi:Bacterial Ig-like domain (group 3)/IPT/TIG domain/Tyrosine-protein kinase ephrin type A/B receptor-like
LSTTNIRWFIGVAAAVGLLSLSALGAPAASAQTTQVVPQTFTTVASSANPSVAGQPVVYTAPVSPAPDGGTVAFTDDGTAIAGCSAQQVAGSGQTICVVTYNSPGTHTITAAYSGDAAFGPSSGQQSITVQAPQCPAGTYGPAGSANCTTTPAGYYDPAGSATPDQCPAGTYQPAAGQANCIPVPVPVVTGVSPASGPLAGGTSVTITGSGFTGASAVAFGATAATSFTVNSDTSITATAPAGASVGAVDVTVTTPNGTSATSQNDQYTYTPVGSATASLTDSNGKSIAGAAVTFRSAGGSVTNATTGPNGTASVVLTPGTYSVTAYYANGYQTRILRVTANGPNAVSFATVAVTAQISDPDTADLAAALVAQAGNTGTYGPKTAVDPSSGQVTFQVLPGTNTFAAYDGSAYTKETLTITAATSTSISVP